ncbi:hypothetical protein NDU88_003567 [Pleurodeles waltl]|uniref:Uncharacterized protein n=1 Tax=Pleurodeles waltl TaxID=8319 RepID=A0AAV7PAE3_PLEWA|nr:hypothetical protein NDU88_003567 [Pleurodeles waltl]
MPIVNAQNHKCVAFIINVCTLQSTAQHYTGDKGSTYLCCPDAAVARLYTRQAVLMLRLNSPEERLIGAHPIM